MDHTPYRKPALTAAQMALLMMVLTLVSKCFGFIRDMVLANFFGTSSITDAYVMAQSIPDILLGGVFAAIGTTYIPVFSEVAERRGKQAGLRFTNQMMTLGILVALAGILVGWAFSDQLIAVFAGKFPPETAHLAAFYLRVTFGYALFTCTNGILSAYLQYHNHFLQPIIAGYAYNAGMIAVIILSALTNHYYLAFGALVGHGLQTVCTFLAARRSAEFRFRPEVAFNADIKRAVLLAVPVFIGSSAGAINGFVDKSLAAGLREGSMAALNYGYILIAVIIGLSTSIVATLTYPRMTKAVTQGDWESFSALGEKSLSVALVFCIPLCLGAAVFSDEVVQVLFERGAFDTTSTALTGEAFAFYSPSLVFMALNGLLTQIYYSMRDMKTPILCSLVSVAVNIGLNLALVGMMEHRGLALATSAAATVNAVLLLAMMKRKHPEIGLFPRRSKVLRICAAALPAVSAAVLVYRLAALVWMPRFFYLFFAVLAAVLVYLMLLRLLKVEEVGVLKELLGKR